jgi:Flp pilus assembly protein TadG
MPFLKVLRDERGAAAIETALALPIVITVLVGAFELGGIMITEMLMEGAVRQASRIGMTNDNYTGLTREETIREILQEGTLGFVNIDDATVKKLVYEDFDSVGKPEPLTVDVNGNGSYDTGDTYVDINGNSQWDADMGAEGLGGPGDVVLYSVSYNYHSMTGLLSPLFGDDGTITLKASTVIRNEPFTASSGS